MNEAWKTGLPEPLPHDSDEPNAAPLRVNTGIDQLLDEAANPDRQREQRGDDAPLESMVR